MPVITQPVSRLFSPPAASAAITPNAISPVPLGETDGAPAAARTASTAGAARARPAIGGNPKSINAQMPSAATPTPKAVACAASTDGVTGECRNVPTPTTTTAIPRTSQPAVRSMISFWLLPMPAAPPPFMTASFTRLDDRRPDRSSSAGRNRRYERASPSESAFDPTFG